MSSLEVLRAAQQRMRDQRIGRSRRTDLLVPFLFVAIDRRWTSGKEQWTVPEPLRGVLLQGPGTIHVQREMKKTVFRCSLIERKTSQRRW